MTAKPKRAMWEALGATRPATEAEKHEARLSFASDIQRWKREWDELQTTPDWRAMEKLEAGIAALQKDPEITANEMCKDLLELLQKLLQRAWPHHDVKKIVAPMQAHFDGERSKKALGYMPRAHYKRQKAALIADISATTGAKPIVVTKRWNELATSEEKRARELAAFIREHAPRPATRTVYRMGKRIKTES